MTALAMQNFVCRAVWLLMCLPFISGSQLPPKLSPRIVKTKYGQLRGVIIDLVPSSSAYADYHQNHRLYQPVQPASGGNHSNPHKSPNESTTAQLNKFLINDLHSSAFASSGHGSPEKIQIEAFLGVSYAQPPVNDRRFLPPVSPAHWRGIKLADQLGPVCMQKLPKELQRSPSDPGSEYNVFRNNQTAEQPSEQTDDEQSSFHRLANFLRNQSEDCLHLNIYVPNFNHQNKGEFEF